MQAKPLHLSVRPFFPDVNEKEKWNEPYSLGDFLLSKFQWLLDVQTYEHNVLILPWRLSDFHVRCHIHEEIESRHDKTNKMTVRPAKTQISMGIRLVWSESSLCAQWVAKDPRFLHADSEDSDQTGQMPRLIWVFAGRTLILLILSCRGSNWFSLRFR